MKRVIVMPRTSRGRVLQQTQSIPAFIAQTDRAAIGIDRFAFFVEILGTDVKRLMNVTDAMRQQNERNRFRDLARVILANIATQNSDAVRNGVDHIPVAASSLAV